jgi:hypothetical protein
MTTNRPSDLSSCAPRSRRLRSPARRRRTSEPNGPPGGKR